MENRLQSDVRILDDLILDVIRMEGWYSDQPADSGNYNSEGTLVGTTYGISANVYEAYTGIVPTKEQMELMPLIHAIDIYKTNYVTPITNNMGIPISSVVFPQVFDMNINHGYGNTVKLIQQVLGLDVDGACGKITKGAIKKVLLNSPNSFNNDLSVERRDFYLSIIDGDPDQEVFRKGWLKRADSFLINKKQVGLIT